MHCECGLSVKSKGLASHLRGNAHACRMVQREAEATGRVLLPGANGQTARALTKRGIDHLAVPSWTPGSRSTPGYRSTLVYVFPNQIPFIACFVSNAAGKRIKVDENMMALQHLRHRVAQVNGISFDGSSVSESIIDRLMGVES